MRPVPVPPISTVIHLRVRVLVIHQRLGQKTGKGGLARQEERTF